MPAKNLNISSATLMMLPLMVTLLMARTRASATVCSSFFVIVMMFCIYVGPEDRVNGAKVHIIYIYSIISPIFFIPIFPQIRVDKPPVPIGVGEGMMVWA